MQEIPRAEKFRMGAFCCRFQRDMIKVGKREREREEMSQFKRERETGWLLLERGQTGWI